MHERRQGAIADEDVAGKQFGVHQGGLGHVVRAQRGGDHALQEACAGMEQGEHVGHRKTTALLLFAGLAEAFLQFGRIGHRKAGTVEQPSAMPKPAPGSLLLAEQTIDHALQQHLEKQQWQACAGLDVCRRGEDQVGQARQGGAGDIAMQDLQEKEVHCGYRIELATPKTNAEDTASFFDPSDRQSFANIGLELPNDFGESECHPWPPERNDKVVCSYHSDQRPRFFPRAKQRQELGLS